MQLLTLPLTSIIIGDRFRKSYENVDQLAESILEMGQIHPPLLTGSDEEGKWHLVAGGRRMAAFQLLGWESALFCVAESLNEDERRELELEENLQREDMTWQEKVLGIAETHRLKRKRAALSSGTFDWGYRQTGQLLNMSLGKVHYCLQAAQEILRSPDGEVAKADSLTEAIRIFAGREENRALAELAARTVTTTTFRSVGGTNVQNIPADDPRFVPDNPVVSLSSMLYNDKIELLMDATDDEWVDHIITDPPYGIDMENLDQSNPHGGMENIDSVREEHDVEYNEELFRFMLPHFFRIIKPNGFCVLWCDIMQWQNLYDLATSVGFKVQRWPLVWHKVHACINQSAQYNYTKNFELAMVCRKGNATLVQPASSSIVVASNDTEKKRLGHPFVKPFEAWEFIIKHVSIQGQTIYEPFAGVGSGVLAMLRMGRRVFATEKKTEHFNKLVENVKQHYLSINKNTTFV